MRILAAAGLALSLVACGGDSFNGTWKGTGTIAVGSNSVPYSSTAVYKSSDHTFNIELDFASVVAGGGTVILQGTYAENGTEITYSDANLKGSTFGTIDATSPANYSCITLNVGVDLCFDVPQSDTYTISGSTLTFQVKFATQTPATTSAAASITEQTPVQVTYTKQ